MHFHILSLKDIPQVCPCPSWGVHGRPASTAEVSVAGQKSGHLLAEVSLAGLPLQYWSWRVSVTPPYAVTGAAGRRRDCTLQGPVVVLSHWSKLSGAWFIYHISPGSVCLYVFIFLLARDGKTYGRASNACVSFFLARVKSLPNVTLFHKNELCHNFALCRVILMVFRLVNC